MLKTEFKRNNSIIELILIHCRDYFGYDYYFYVNRVLYSNNKNSANFVDDLN